METKIESEQNSEINLDRKSKILFIVIGVLIAGSVAVTFWRYMVKRDYIIESQIDCDPETENCFVWQCDPMSLEEGEKCTGVPDNDIWYYKILNRNAKNIPNCDPKDENCTAYQCDPGESKCEITNCSPDSLKSGEECSTPEQYLKDNPPKEEIPVNEECTPDDEECLNQSAGDAAECAPDDENCASQSDSETGEISPASQDASPDVAAPAQ